MKIHQPPSAPLKILSLWCKPELLEDLEGDLFELYQMEFSKHGKTKANLLLFWHVIRSLRRSALKKSPISLNENYMWKNNMKIAFRVIKKNKFNTTINLVSLIIGISSFLILGLYTKQELSYDRYHEKSERIYRLWLKEVPEKDKIFFNASTPFRFEGLMENNFPEVEQAVIKVPLNGLVGESNNQINETISLVSKDFFTVFDFNFIKGNASSCLDQANLIAISSQMATKYFGEINPIGKTLPILLRDSPQNFTISAVFENSKRVHHQPKVPRDTQMTNHSTHSVWNELSNMLETRTLE